MIIESAQKAFDVALYNFAQANSIDVAIENVDYKPNTKEPFLAGFMLDADITSADLSVNEMIEYIYQIDVRYPSHVGLSVINKMLDLLRAEFSIGQCKEWQTDCFCINSLDISSNRVDAGWSVKSISLTISGYTPTI